jgi:plasmid stabilization system protein ParE
MDERNAQGAANVKRAIRKVIELIGQFPHGGSSIGEEEVRVVPVGHYPYADYWPVTRREAVILHIRHNPRRGGGVGAFSSSRVSEIAACERLVERKRVAGSLRQAQKIVPRSHSVY